MLTGTDFFAIFQVLANSLSILETEVEWLDLKFLTLALPSTPIFPYYISVLLLYQDKNPQR